MAFKDLPDAVRAEYERIGREREREGRELERASRLELLRVCAELIAWTVAGLLIAGVAFRVGDYELGMVFLYGGMLVNVAGVAYSIWSAYLRGQARGDW